MSSRRDTEEQIFEVMARTEARGVRNRCKPALLPLQTLVNDTILFSPILLF